MFGGGFGSNRGRQAATSNDASAAEATGQASSRPSSIHQRKSSDELRQKDRANCGALFVITFITSIPAALLLYSPVLDHTNYILGAGARDTAKS